MAATTKRRKLDGLDERNFWSPVLEAGSLRSRSRQAPSEGCDGEPAPCLPLSAPGGLAAIFLGLQKHHANFCLHLYVVFFPHACVHNSPLWKGRPTGWDTHTVQPITPPNSFHVFENPPPPKLEPDSPRKACATKPRPLLGARHVAPTSCP